MPQHLGDAEAQLDRRVVARRRRVRVVAVVVVLVAVDGERDRSPARAPRPASPPAGVLPEHPERPVEQAEVLRAAHERRPRRPSRRRRGRSTPTAPSASANDTTALTGTASPAPRSTRANATAIASGVVVGAAVAGIGVSVSSRAASACLTMSARPCCSTRSWSSRYLSTVPSVAATACSSSWRDAEAAERGGPVDRLGDARRLVQRQVAQRGDGGGDLAGERLADLAAPAGARWRPRGRSPGARPSGTGSAA